MFPRPWIGRRAAPLTEPTRQGRTAGRSVFLMVSSINTAGQPVVAHKQRRRDNARAIVHCSEIPPLNSPAHPRRAGASRFSRPDETLARRTQPEAARLANRSVCALAGHVLHLLLVSAIELGRFSGELWAPGTQRTLAGGQILPCAGCFPRPSISVGSEAIVRLTLEPVFFMGYQVGRDESATWLTQGGIAGITTPNPSDTQSLLIEHAN
jgi:hypothetical protein